MEFFQSFSQEDGFILLLAIFVLSLVYLYRQVRLDHKEDIVFQFHLRWSEAVFKDDSQALLLVKQGWHDWLIQQDTSTIRATLHQRFYGNPETNKSIESAWAQMSEAASSRLMEAGCYDWVSVQR